MRGHLAIVAARKAGYKPSSIFFEIGFPERPVRYAFEDPEHALATGQYAKVVMSEVEPWRTYDLRFVTGCCVHVLAANWGEELTALLDKIAANGAAQIAAVVTDHPVLLHYREGKWIAHPA